MTERVVDLLEAVQVHEEQGKCVVLTSRDLQRLLGELEEGAAILELSQLVHERERLEQLGISAQGLFPFSKRNVRSMLVHGDLDRAAKLDFLERLDDVAERPGRDRALQCRRIAVTGEENHRYRRSLLNQPSCLNAVDFAAKAHVHDDELRLKLLRHSHRLRSFARNAADAITEAGQGLREIMRDNAFVLHEQNGGRSGV